MNEFKETVFGLARRIGLLLSLVALWLLPLCQPTILQADTLIVVNKGDATVSLINLLDGKVAAIVPTGQGPHEIAISFDGATAVVTNYGDRTSPGSTLTVIDVREARVVKTIALGEYRRPHGIVWRNQESVLVTVEENKALIQVNVGTGEIEHAFATGQETSHMVALAEARGGGVVQAWVANLGSGSVTVFDLESGKHIANFATGEGAEGITATRGRAWVTNRAADTVTVLDVDTGDIVAQLPCEGFPIRAETTPNGRHVLVSRARAGDVVVFNADDPTAEPRILDLDVEMKTTGDTEDRLFDGLFGSSSVPIGIQIGRFSERVWVAHAHADVISEHDLPTGKRTRILHAGREPDGMAYTKLAVKSTEEVLINR